jgi:predicted RNA-binding protein with PIN domain
MSNMDAHNILKKAIIDAKSICSSDLLIDEYECAVAWDTVDEIAHGIAIREARDPLEDYCAENPDADECRTYDV